jgi:hypothetical protein
MRDRQQWIVFVVPGCAQTGGPQGVRDSFIITNRFLLLHPSSATLPETLVRQTLVRPFWWGVLGCWTKRLQEGEGCVR